jgi:hypothetical protein
MPVAVRESPEGPRRLYLLPWPGLAEPGRAQVRSDFSAQRFAELLEAIYDRDEGLRWYERRQQVLNGKTPRELVAAGNIQRVRRAINEIRDGVLL